MDLIQNEHSVSAHVQDYVIHNEPAKETSEAMDKDLIVTNDINENYSESNELQTYRYVFGLTLFETGGGANLPRTPQTCLPFPCQMC